MKNKLDELDIEIERFQRKIKTNKLIVSLLILILIISTILYIFNINVIGFPVLNKDVKTIIEVSDIEKYWYEHENLDIFQKTNEKGEKIIAPGDNGLYSFVIKNAGNNIVNYKLDLIDKNKGNINMRYRLKMNNVYVLGTSQNWITTSELELHNITIAPKSKMIYTLEWKWIDSEIDTDIGKEANAIYTVYVNVSVN